MRIALGGVLKRRAISAATGRGWRPECARRRVRCSKVASHKQANDGDDGDGAALCYRRHRFPPAVIQHAIWLYLHFTLSYRDVEELLAERGSTSPTKRCGAER